MSNGVNLFDQPIADKIITVRKYCSCFNLVTFVVQKLVNTSPLEYQKKTKKQKHMKYKSAKWNLKQQFIIYIILNEFYYICYII